jgi:pilus assembly protein CpaB
MKGLLAGRSMALVAALALSAFGTFALVSYVKGIEASTRKGEKLVHSFIAKDFIPAGTDGETAISDGLVAREEVPQRLLPEDAIQSLDEIQNRVAKVDILKGEQILSARFVKSSETEGIVAIPAGRQAMSVEVESPPGVAGFVRPNARVSIIAQLTEPRPRAEFVLQDVQVLAIGQGALDGAGATTADTQGKVLLTLAVTPSEAEKLAFAVSQGEVYFTLLPPDQEALASENTSSSSDS